MKCHDTYGSILVYQCDKAAIEMPIGHLRKKKKRNTLDSMPSMYTGRYKLLWALSAIEICPDVIALNTTWLRSKRCPTATSSLFTSRFGTRVVIGKQL